MSRFAHRLLIAVSAILLVSAFALAQDQVTKISKKDLPAPVLTAFQREYPQAKIVGASRDTENKVEYYEITCKERGAKREMRYHADGSLVSVSEKIRLRDLPPLVRESVKRKYPTAKIKSAEKVSQGGVNSFEVLVKDAGRRLELTVAADGSITETEKVTGKDKD